MTQITLPRQVGIVVSESRKALGMTQYEVAKTAGVSRQLVNRLEMGSATGIALDKLMAILDSVNCVMEVVSCVSNEDKPGEESTVYPLRQKSALRDYDPFTDYPLDETLFNPTRSA